MCRLMQVCVCVCYAETKQLLDIVARSLYTEKEVGGASTAARSCAHAGIVVVLSELIVFSSVFAL